MVGVKPEDSSPPLIPETYFDVPTQRLYALSFGLLCQAVKLFDVFQYLLTFDEDTSTSYVTKWIIVDVVYILAISQLRIPRLRYTPAVVALQIMTLCLLNGILFGGISINLGLGLSLSSIGLSGGRDAASTGRFHISDLVPAPLGFLASSNYGKDSHLLGQHTVRMSPISTAQLNPNGDTFCLDTQSGSNVLIPVLLNNTNPVGFRYTLTPLGYMEGVDALRKVETIDLSAKDLKAIENARWDSLQLTRTTTTSSKLDVDDPDYDEYDDDDESSNDAASSTTLQKSQTLAHIRLTKPGTVRLERVLDNSNVDARLMYPLEVTVAPCPKAEFIPDEISRGKDTKCAATGVVSGHPGSAAGEDVKFNIDIFGVPPLSLRWFKDVNGRREYFTVEGIEGDQIETKTRGGSGSGVAQKLNVPLTVSLDAIGTHIYTLESVTDRYGNAAAVSTADRHTKSTRSITVLRRPNVSFKACGPGHPSSLLIGSETPITISTHEADPLDGPWGVTIKYQPESRKQKGWTRTLKTPQNKRDLVLRANAPGEYTIQGVKGKHCEGDVLSPDVCKVVEMPYPTAEIEWKKIHECSGDTGVSASLVLHGTPPFQVYYRMQRDKEAPLDKVKTFATSRGDFTLQPDQSGFYSFSFTQLSDANYKKIDLKGPSIDQVIHPLASAEFVHSGGATGRGKKSISSCGGSTVDVDVDLKGTGPWKLELQIVGPKGSTNLPVQNIVSNRHTVQVPIPAEVDQEGGSFEVVLVSIEDNYGCKRPINVPSTSVHVRRIQPTARFYGKGERKITVLEQEKAELPLRLTGDGPWRLNYARRESPNDVQSVVLRSPNDQLIVKQAGLYEIVEIKDSQCPGSVVPEESTYLVEWVPRPFARLSPETESTYNQVNGSHILPPICESLIDQVDLDLTGRPPFQIMYNVARDNGAGGIKLLDQPVFNSIQPHTRFQLHTHEAGRIYYEVKQIGDAAYPLAKHREFVIPRADRLLFEQEVLMRPSARFKNNNRIPYCLHDQFKPRDAYSQDGLISLEGTAPFTINLSVRNLAAGETFVTAVEVKENSWRIELPDYTFKSIGPYLVTIDSIQDVSRCDQTVSDPLYRSVWVDVAETAAIVPFDRREHFCEGEVSQFQLEGNPPWNIGYRIDGKSYLQEAKTSPFSLVQQQAGEFSIVSVAHQQKMCKTAVTDLRYTVHPLPAAQVGHGKKILQDIHEGDQAEVLFTLIGEPPFTFTYQRSELTTKKSGKPPKVLETHTVSGVTAKEYSIYSALEGTWTVSFISDKYCRYPPASSDAVTDKRY